MKLLQVTILCLLPSLCSSSNDNLDAKITTTPVSSSSMSATQTLTPKPEISNLVTKSTFGSSFKVGTSKESSPTSLPMTLASFTTTAKGEGATANDATKNQLNTTEETVTNVPLSNFVSTVESSQHKTENESSIKTTKRPVISPQPDASPSETSTSPSVSAAMTENISQSQGTENAKNSSSSSTSPSYSSIILPVVIALIVITLSAFVLVGLYRMCRKTDPGTPENGNDQPQSDKESVKLLTVKTISHESGEHSAQGKTKN
ncbi:endomucin isoform 1-T1 [Hipposideros larvatus]